MHQKFAALLLVPAVLLLSHCETWEGGMMPPPPSDYETARAPEVDAPENTSGPQAPPMPPRPYRPERSQVVDHRVVPGDSLWSLSRKYETTIAEIREANQLEGDVIRTGTTLKIPTSLSAPPSRSSKPEESAAMMPTFSTTPRQAPSPTSSWTITPPSSSEQTVRSSVSSNSAPQFRIPEPVIMPPPGDY